MIKSLGMKEFFIPYDGETPASICINGHRLLIVSRDREELEENLGLVGGNRLEQFVTSGVLMDEDEDFLESLAHEVNGGIVIAPEDAPLTEVIRSLESELPWIQ
jgi:hypothetical protein